VKIKDLRQFHVLQSVTLLAFCFTTLTTAQTLTALYNFQGPDGSAPIGPLVQGTDGNFYGTTSYGGNLLECTSAPGCGTVFKVTSTGTLTTLHSFCAQPNCKDGAYPLAALVQGADGKFYGTTSAGGNASSAGTVFRITASGKLKTLYAFCPQTKCTDGSTPVGLIRATDGNFYGVTESGGNSNSLCYPNGCGTLFRITPQGKFTEIYNFCSQPNCSDGDLPSGNLVEGTDGNLYGATAIGGTGGPPSGAGTIFRITTGGLLTTIYSFCPSRNCTDGSSPNGVIQGGAGNFYGTTLGGGGPENAGTAFSVTPSGTLTTLYVFCSLHNCQDGFYPAGSLVQATDGNFYGVTIYGGTYAGGEIFNVSAGGTFDLVYAFDGTGGAYPSSGPVQGTDGSFYGVATMGGNSPENCNNYQTGCGTVYNLSMGLGPFIETRPTSGKIGKKVIILGNSLTGATSVEFSGTAATFKVVSGTEITTRVPTGATTGFVTVTTPNGTLTSNVQFVIP